MVDSLWAAVLQDKRSLAWVLLHGLQLPSGPVHILQDGLLHELQCGSLLHGPPQPAGAQLSHHGLLYGLQGNLCVKCIFFKCFVLGRYILGKISGTGPSQGNFCGAYHAP